jgi:hypothetical protein
MEVPSDGLLRIKTYIHRCLEATPALNEANTKAALVEPLLGLLGWDVGSPREVNREWRPGPHDQPVDYALLAAPGRVLIMEVKRLKDPLVSDKGWKQLAANGLTAGVRWCVRTNGRRYVLVNLLHEADLDGKMFWDLDLRDVEEPGGMTVRDAWDCLRLVSKKAFGAAETERAWEEAEAYRLEGQLRLPSLVGPPAYVELRLRSAVPLRRTGSAAGGAHVTPAPPRLSGGTARAGSEQGAARDTLSPLEAVARALDLPLERIQEMPGETVVYRLWIGGTPGDFAAPDLYDQRKFGIRMLSLFKLRPGAVGQEWGGWRGVLALMKEAAQPPDPTDLPGFIKLKGRVVRLLTEAGGVATRSNIQRRLHLSSARLSEVIEHLRETGELKRLDLIVIDDGRRRG